MKELKKIKSDWLASILGQMIVVHNSHPPLALDPILILLSFHLCLAVLVSHFYVVSDTCVCVCVRERERGRERERERWNV
jgi:hypothetical protein